MQTIPSIHEPQSAARYKCGKCPRTVSLPTTCFCQTCSALLCPLCVVSQIHSLYCPNCLDAVLEDEARVFNNRCKKCFICPNCACTLTFKAVKRAHGTSESDEEEVFLSCHNCLWSSADPELPGEPLVADSPTTLITKLMAAENDDEKHAWFQKCQQQVQKVADEDARREGADTIGSYYSLSTRNVKTPLGDAAVDTWPQIPSKATRPVPQRRPLLPFVDKYCGSCNRLLVRPDNLTTSPMGGGHSVLDFKRRHVGCQLVPWIHGSIDSAPADAEGYQTLTLLVINLQPSQPMNILIRPTASLPSASGKKYCRVDPNRLPAVLSFAGDDDLGAPTRSLKTNMFVLNLSEEQEHLAVLLDVKFSSVPFTAADVDSADGLITVQVEVNI